MSKHIEEAEKLLPDKKTYQNTKDWMHDGAYLASGYNEAIEDCIPAVIKLLEEIDNLKDKITSITINYVLLNIPIKTRCIKCNGTGTVLYGSTSTFLGGIGGQMMTEGVCDRCWGTGRKDKTGVNLKKLLEENANLKQK